MDKTKEKPAILAAEEYRQGIIALTQAALKTAPAALKTAPAALIAPILQALSAEVAGIAVQQLEAAKAEWEKENGADERYEYGYNTTKEEVK